ncbi:MAG: hypothetical protein M3536_12630 [Actinomycetota bacterium]|nr:hypothetical protein [Actinomycetota bacterium]
MGAEVEEISLYSASCAYCLTASEPDEFEDVALEWAANHNAENHSTYTDEDAADDAREHDIESRKGY